MIRMLLMVSVALVAGAQIAHAGTCIFGEGQDDVFACGRGDEDACRRAAALGIPHVREPDDVRALALSCHPRDLAIAYPDAAWGQKESVAALGDRLAKLRANEVPALAPQSAEEALAAARPHYEARSVRLRCTALLQGALAGDARALELAGPECDNRLFTFLRARAGHAAVVEAAMKELETLEVKYARRPGVVRRTKKDAILLIALAGDPKALGWLRTHAAMRVNAGVKPVFTAAIAYLESLAPR